MLAIARRGGRNNDGDAAGRSMLDWLRAHGQSERAISRFWAVVLVSALNEELARTDARYGLDVFWKAFLCNRSGYVVGIPSVPLGELYEGCRAIVERRGGEVLCRAAVRGLKDADGRITAVAMGISIAATILPARAAVRLLPVEILRYE